MRLICGALIALVLTVAAPHGAARAADASAAPAAALPWLVPPVDGNVSRGFEAPGTEWGPGHRGIDLSIPSGSSIRAAAAGTVTFAGSVGNSDAITIDHGAGLETTYSDLASIHVAEGDRVSATTLIGVAGSAHGAEPGGVHLGVKLHGDYVDPARFLGPMDVGSAIHLAPLVWEPPVTLPPSFRTPFLSASAPEGCDPKGSISDSPAPPNDNIAVLVAGIGSKTEGGTSAALYEEGESLLGYNEVYPFSYRGSNGPSLHEPYARIDTFGDIRLAAAKLRKHLEEISALHPGRQVDLIAHSQGGIVARTYLSTMAETWNPRVPRVEHLVTFSSPHNGAPLAAARPVLDRTLSGRALLRAGSWWSRNGGALPDPYAESVGQLAPGSALMSDLARQTVVYGTRVLTLAIPHDLVVPADTSRWPGHAHSVVPPAGINAHDAIVTSPVARGIVHSFLRDRPAPCSDGWDLWGPRFGRAISAIESWLPRGYRAVEEVLLGD